MIFRRWKRRQASAEESLCERVRQSDLFDSVWYLTRYPDVAEAKFDPVVHYVRHGAREGRKPGPWFEPQLYLSKIADRDSVENPLLHYLDNPNYCDLSNSSPNVLYHNFREFLTYTLVDPIVPAPFREEDLRSFAAMDAVAKYLVEYGHSEKPLVSVIMPVRNRVLTIERAVTSVLKQGYRDFELIIVDDGSDDGTCALIAEIQRSDERVRLIRLGTHQGVCAARNVGLDESRGDLIAYLDSDNSWEENYLGATVGAFAKLSDADAIYSGQYIFGSEDPEVLTAVRFAAMNVSLLEQHNYIDLNCFAHRRSVIKNGLRFDVNLKRLVDWSFILAVNELHRIYSVPFLQSNYFLHASERSITKDESFELAHAHVELWRNQRPETKAYPQLTKSVCIVIPSFQAVYHLERCIASLEQYKDNPMVEIIIVDNASEMAVLQLLERFRKRGVRVLMNEINYGFSYAVNQGVSTADSEADILLLNNDAELSNGCLEYLQQAAYESTDIAMTVPRQILPAGNLEIATHVPYASTSAECDVTLSRHHANVDHVDTFHDGQRVDLNFAPFFCVYVKRTVWDKAGGLDYESGRHYRSDRVMCDFIRQILHQRIIYTPYAKVFHGSQVATEHLKNDPERRQEYKTMLIDNAWPSELRRRLNIKTKPWQKSRA